MKFGARLHSLWYRIDSSLWFRPLMMILGAIFLAMGLLEADTRFGASEAAPRMWSYTGGAQGARTILSLIAGTFISIFSLAFSVTIVTLTLATSQFGPRLMNNFMRDSHTHYTLGYFAAVFVYCLLVIRAVPQNEGFTPGLSVSGGLVLAVIGFVLIIYFIHHVASSIKADKLISLVEGDLKRTIARMYPRARDLSAPHREQRKAAKLPPDFTLNAAPARALDTGYVEAVEYDALLALATKRDLVFKLFRKPGEYVTKDVPLLLAYPLQDVGEELNEAVNNHFLLGSQRTPLQDLEFTINQLVEVALRALSPGINDTFTALTCIDRLGSAMSMLARREMDSPYALDKDGELRLVKDVFIFGTSLDKAFDLLRQNGAGNPAVLVRLLDALTAVAMQTTDAEVRDPVAAQARLILRQSERSVPEEADQADVRARYDRLKNVLAGKEVQNRDYD